MLSFSHSLIMETAVMRIGASVIKLNALNWAGSYQWLGHQSTMEIVEEERICF